MHPHRKKLADFFESRLFQMILLGLIIVNAIGIGLETSKDVMHKIGFEFEVLEYFILGAFILELLTKMIVFRRDFFKHGWNIFDLSVIVISILPHAAGLTILRSFRVFHSLSLFELSPHTRHLLAALRHVGPSALNVVIFMLVGFYILAVIGVELFSEQFPERFGTLGWSFFTLFRLMIYDDYGAIVRPILLAYPYSWIFFLSATLILAFVLLNLFVAVVVTALQRAVQNDEDPLEKNVKDQAKLITIEVQEIDNLKNEIGELKKMVSQFMQSKR
ncbi:Ion transport protein [Candidatus Bealeia paramacronuclearis]|uniref:Ion transport protein n=1 Tax=Candidatus Bealeia paramacronuclearis TaxID=1921001 RepID=A0ABZ2C498_9PROT|nr:Ion transport protein [Candidatus Bealeia paramacronuclearis]